MQDSNENKTEKKGIIDSIMERAISRKLLVFIVATALLYLEVGLDADTWGMIAMTYILSLIHISEPTRLV